MMLRVLLPVLLASGCTRADPAPPPPPAVLPALAAPRPLPHQLHYRLSAMAGVWHGKTMLGFDLHAELDLVQGSIATRDPDGERHRDLSSEEARELRKLAIAACEASRAGPRNTCTDVYSELSIDEGACHATIGDSCPLDEPTAARLVAAISHAASWR